jgi:hypothetical protein
MDNAVLCTQLAMCATYSTAAANAVSGHWCVCVCVWGGCVCVWGVCMCGVCVCVCVGCVCVCVCVCVCGGCAILDRDSPIPLTNLN